MVVDFNWNKKKNFKKGAVLMGFIGLFFLSLNAWMDGDDSMAWYVVLVVVLIIIGSIVGAAS